MRDTLLGCALLASACGAHAGDADLSEAKTACSWQGDVTAAFDADEICSLFAEAIAASDRPDVGHLSIRLTGPHSVRVVAYSEAGQELLALDFDVMDRSIDLAVWHRIARSFASQLPAD